MKFFRKKETLPTVAGEYTPLLPADEEQRRRVLEALAHLSKSASFQVLLDCVRSRLAELDRANRVRGRENGTTEAQAWEWLLAGASLAEELRPRPVIEQRGAAEEDRRPRAERTP